MSIRQIEEYHLEWICPECLAKLPRTEQDIKPENLTETALTKGKTEIKKTLHLDRAASYLFYDKNHPIQRAIHRMKYTDQPEIGWELGRQAVIDWRDERFFEGIDAIIPIPLHPARMRERGYNQSEYIARGISEITGIPVDTTHVTRIRNTPQQAKQDGEGRRTNMDGAFAVLHPEQMYHQHFLVVDDLITTGETMKACLHTMRAFRGARFSVFALCKAR